MPTTSGRSLVFPFPEAPPSGAAIEVAPGILWLRAPLPFRLDHVNLYLIEDGDGWAVLDAGINDDPTRAVWSALFSGLLAGRKLTRLIVTHYHPDHIGLAGWLCQNFDAPLFATQTTFLSTINISLSPGALDAKPYRDFYLKNGLDADKTARVTTSGHGYLKMVAPLPPIFTRIVRGDELVIGKRRFSVMTGDGHAPEQAMLWCAEEKLFFAADQVIEKITPNVSVWAVDPHGDPLGLFMRSLTELKAAIPQDALVLPGHRLPFIGLHQRCDELIAHHDERCDLIEAACRQAPCSVAQLLPVIFPRVTDPHQMSFAFSEVLAHVNYMLRQKQLVWTKPQDGVERMVAA